VIVADARDDRKTHAGGKKSIMKTRVYVDNLAGATTCDEVVDLFSAYGNVAGINLPVDRANGRPRGFGFVTMATSEGAQAAIQALNGKAIGTCTLTVSEAWPHEDQAGVPCSGRNPRRCNSCLF
jgi:RNA recognition motif-containing protein